jgi:hypothetical protein
MTAKKRASGSAPSWRSEPEAARLLEVPPQLPAVTWVTQLAQRFGLDLTDPFTGNAKLATDFFECAEPTVLQPEAEDNDLPLSLRELAQRFANLRFQ